MNDFNLTKAFSDARKALEQSRPDQQQELEKLRLELEVLQVQAELARANVGQREIPQALITPSKATNRGKSNLAKVLIRCRQQAGCKNWTVFCQKALTEAGVSVKRCHFDKAAPTATYFDHPNFGIIFALEYWGIFTFQNGEKITAYGLFEVLMGLRSADGDKRG